MLGLEAVENWPTDQDSCVEIVRRGKARAERVVAGDGMDGGKKVASVFDDLRAFGMRLVFDFAQIRAQLKRRCEILADAARDGLVSQNLCQFVIGSVRSQGHRVVESGFRG